VGALAPEARLLDAPERCHLGRDDPRVQADDAEFEALGHPQCAADVARVKIGRQSVLDAIGCVDHVSLAAEPEHRGDRPEGLVARHQHLIGDVGQHRRLEVRSP
jgi:hypothetical protein